MKLTSFKVIKLAVIVICMLAAGICYSCSVRNRDTGPENMVMALESDSGFAVGERGGLKACGTGTNRKAGPCPGTRMESVCVYRTVCRDRMACRDRKVRRDRMACCPRKAAGPGKIRCPGRIHCPGKICLWYIFMYAAW